MFLHKLFGHFATYILTFHNRIGKLFQSQLSKKSFFQYLKFDRYFFQNYLVVFIDYFEIIQKGFVPVVHTL